MLVSEQLIYNGLVKTIDISFFGMAIAISLGNTMYGTIYLASVLLNEKYGEKAARKAVWFGFFTLIATTIIMQMALAFNPLDSEFPLQVQGALETLFGRMPRIALGSIGDYLASQFLDVKIYSGLNRLCPARISFVCGRKLYFQRGALEEPVRKGRKKRDGL
ncbi:queuosine precursor transporter [Paenibacillus harenae]|uniref:queuosine precursor transporter n=1 Tax=Paenibacillus harenae TaxID=306543 RepID=UPI00040283DB|nr:queuosine precursor transporter [Paenibacillus harenae]